MTRFVLRAEPPLRLSLDGLIPERLAGLAPGEIERLPLLLGNHRGTVGDWFQVEEGAADLVQISGAGARLDRIGDGMTTGRIVVEGEAGAYLGRAMRGGSIEVAGDAGFGAAMALQGGTIHIAGRAGDGLAGALPGAAGGMTGGEVRVDGGAGHGVAHRLRRGLVVIGGDVAGACAEEMIAGTIVIGGHLAAPAGAAMRRGSLMALGGIERLAPGFADCGPHELIFLCLLARHLSQAGLGALAERLTRLRRWAGDLAVAGRGEILVPP
jgi:formylmethanofuran dehydrogenase subunit C